MGWLWRLFGWRSGWSERQRSIFRYFNGQAWQYADPLVIQRKLKEHGGKDWMASIPLLSRGGGVDPAKLSPAIADDMEAKYEHAVEKLSALSRKVFEIFPVGKNDKNGKPIGLTDAECLDLLASYILFVNGLEAEFRPLLKPSSSGPQASTAGTIDPIAASSSIETISEPVEPKTSPTESLWPSPSDEPTGEWQTNKADWTPWPSDFSPGLFPGK